MSAAVERGETRLTPGPLAPNAVAEVVLFEQTTRASSVLGASSAADTSTGKLRHSDV